MTDRVKNWLARLAAEGLFDLKQKPGEGLCLVKGCRKEGCVNKTGLCHRHHQARWRMKNPKRSLFRMWRDHAIARKIEFTLEPAYVDGLVDAYAFFDHTAESRGETLSLDRVDATVGYRVGNVRIITQSQNAAKSHRERHLPAHVQVILDRKRAKAKDHPALADEREDDDDRMPF